MDTATAIDVCEACQNWGANHQHDHDTNGKKLVVTEEDKETNDEQIVPVYTQKVQE